MAIYAGGTGKPNFIRSPKIKYYLSCTYDDQGNLIVTGYTKANRFVLGELLKGSDDFHVFRDFENLYGATVAQWDGQYVALAAKQTRLIYQINLSGTKATIVQKIRLYMPRKVESASFWLQGQTLLTITGANKHKVGLWRYPHGGKAEMELGPVIQGKGILLSLTVSVAPPH